jgi:hypothetical protein
MFCETNKTYGFGIIFSDFFAPFITVKYKRPHGLLISFPLLPSPHNILINPQGLRSDHEINDSFYRLCDTFISRFLSEATFRNNTSFRMVPLCGPSAKDNYLPIVLRGGFFKLWRRVLWRRHTVAWSRGVSARRGGRIAGRYRPRVARTAAPTWVRCRWIRSVAIGWVLGLDAGHGVPWVRAHGRIPWNRHTDGVCGHYSVLFLLLWRLPGLRRANSRVKEFSILTYNAYIALYSRR